jgi:hypothetical protein
MTRARSILVALVIGALTLITWEVGALVRGHQSPHDPPSTATLPVVP